jgi:hypothetical protein
MPEYYAGMGGGNRFELIFAPIQSLEIQCIKYESPAALDASPDVIAILVYNSLGRKRRLQ